ncbi:hypothetical protein IQ250_09110 [Pseudanabaenaceae cyanobacterium LEGE 13415]|nr:hypothetical protein [Pseudanabaenaceae cyanobacterium LEGE 13415]
MKTIDISEIAALLETYGESEQPFLLTRNGQPIAAVLPVGENADLESLSLSTNPKFAEIIERSRNSQKEQGRIFLEDL